MILKYQYQLRRMDRIELVVQNGKTGFNRDVCILSIKLSMKYQQNLDHYKNFKRISVYWGHLIKIGYCLGYLLNFNLIYDIFLLEYFLTYTLYFNSDS